MKITLSEIKKMVREELLKEQEDKREEASDLASFVTNIKEMLEKHLKNKVDYNNMLALIELYVNFRDDQKAKKLLDSDGNIDPEKMKQFLNNLKGEVTNDEIGYGGVSKEELGKELSLESRRRKNRFSR
jgi:hypothetical protein